MWAHYADNHRGFCVEYEVRNPRSIKVSASLHPISYSSAPLILDVEELLFTPKQAIIRIVTTKSSHWAYENEYRTVYLKALDPTGPRGS